jgi:hypothetical protein
VKPLNRLLKKDARFELDNDGKKAFQHIKEEITIALVLISPNFYKDFIIFSFASQDTITGIILEKDDQGDEQSIAFMRKTLRDLEPKYTITEKQSYTLVKSLKHFRTYVGYNKIKYFVPYPTMKDVLSQQDCLRSRGKWVSQIHEYNLEIKTSKIIKGQELAQMLT